MNRNLVATGTIITVVGCTGWFISNVFSSKIQAVQHKARQSIIVSTVKAHSQPDNTSMSFTGSNAPTTHSSQNKLDQQVVADFTQYVNIVSHMSWNSPPEEIYKTLNPVVDKARNDLSMPILGDQAWNNLWIEVGDVYDMCSALQHQMDAGAPSSFISSAVVQPLKTKALQSASDVKSYLGRNS